MTAPDVKAAKERAATILSRIDAHRESEYNADPEHFCDSYGCHDMEPVARDVLALAARVEQLETENARLNGILDDHFHSCGRRGCRICATLSAAAPDRHEPQA